MSNSSFGADLIEKLPPIFPAKVLEEKSEGYITARRLVDMRRDKTGPDFFKTPGGRQVLYTRDAVARWLTANSTVAA